MHRFFDIRYPNSLKEGLSKIKNSINCLINSAGIRDEETSKGIKNMFDVNMNGAFYLLHLSQPKLAYGAKIVQISSGLATALPRNNLGYATSKLASYNIAKQFAALYPNFDVKIALPGPIDTPLFRRGKSRENIEKINPKSPLYLAEKIIELLESDKKELICINNSGVWAHELR